MQERKVSTGDQTYVLPAPFLVIATQNPVEQAGTFELPEAHLEWNAIRQLDIANAARFCLAIDALSPWESQIAQFLFLLTSTLFLARCSKVLSNVAAKIAK